MTADAGDGRHVPKSLYTAPGGFVQLDDNHTLVEVAPGTEGQVPTYTADGSLAAADATSGSSDTLLSIALTSTAGYDDVNSAFFHVPETGNFTVSFTVPVTDVSGSSYLEFVVNNEASAVAKLLRLSVLVYNLNGSGDFLHCRDLANGTTVPASGSVTVADFFERAVSGTSIIVDSGGSEGLNLAGAGDFSVTFYGRFDNQ